MLSAHLPAVLAGPEMIAQGRQAQLLAEASAETAARAARVSRQARETHASRPGSPGRVYASLAPRGGTDA